MKRLIGAVVVLALIGGAVWVGLASRKALPAQQMGTVEPSEAASELECPEDDLIQSTEALYPFGARGFIGDPEGAVRRILEGLLPTDLLRTIGSGDEVEVQIERNGKLVGRAFVTHTEKGGWLVGSSSVCGSSRILHN